jgi:hypothetical protein
LYYPQQGSVAFTLDNGPFNFGNLSGKALETASGGSANAFSGSSNHTYLVSVK